jgi:hypothetical protein
VNTLAALEADADAKRLQLEETLRNLEKRATLLGLADDIIARAGAPTSGEIIEALRRKPVLALGLALCVGLLALEVGKTRRYRQLRNRGPREVARTSPAGRHYHENEETYDGS